MRDPAVLDLLIAVRVCELKRDALAGALPLFPKPGLTKTRLPRPRPVLVLPFGVEFCNTFGGKPDLLYSLRAFPLLTQLRHGRLKTFVAQKEFSFLR